MNLEITEVTWLFILSLIGQALFSMRFLVQWIASERRKKSIIPIAFWYFSVAGGVSLLVYCILRGEYVLAFGQLTGLVVYSRNLFIIRREKRLNLLDETPVETNPGVPARHGETEDEALARNA